MTVNGNTIYTYFIYDGEKPILEYDLNGGLTGTNVYGKSIDEILMRTEFPSNLTYYYQDNHVGSVTHLMLANGTVIESCRYDAFGAPTITTAQGYSPNNRFMFTGREYIKQFGIYEYRARAYHPGIGQFMSEDPKGFDGGDYNLFRYCKNDPLDLTDPMGLQSYPGTSPIGASVNPPVPIHYREIRMDTGSNIPTVTGTADGIADSQGNFSGTLTKGGVSATVNRGSISSFSYGNVTVSLAPSGNGSQSPAKGTGYTITRQQMAEYHGWGLLYRSDVGFNYTLRDPDGNPVPDKFIDEKIKLSENRGFVYLGRRTGGETTDKNGIVQDVYGGWFLRQSSSVRITQTMSIAGIGSATWSGIFKPGGVFIPDQLTAEFTK